MRTYLSNCRLSCKELKKTRSIVMLALLAAMSIVIGGFKLKLFPYLHISFSGLVDQYAYMLFGPVSGMVYAAVVDIAGEILLPSGGFNLLFTISPVVGALIFGSFYYKRPLTLVNILAVNFIAVLICNVTINTIVISYTQGKAMMAILPLRALKNLIQWPVDSLLFYSMAKLLSSYGRVRTEP